MHGSTTAVPPAFYPTPGEAPRGSSPQIAAPALPVAVQAQRQQIDIAIKLIDQLDEAFGRLGVPHLEQGVGGAALNEKELAGMLGALFENGRGLGVLIDRLTRLSARLERFV